MKTIFDKNHHVLMDKECDGTITGHDHWLLAIHSQRHEGFDRVSPMIRMELLRGARGGDVWCMCELAREYFRLGDDTLPEALYWWKRAIQKSDQGAIADLANMDIENRILNYRVKDSEFAIACTKIAMLAGLYLIDLGKTPWKTNSMQDKHNRMTKLLNKATEIVGIDRVGLVHEESLVCAGIQAAGIADPGNRRIRVIDGIYNKYDITYALQVVFHEMGHFVIFDMRENNDRGRMLKQRYEVSQERINSYIPYTYKPGYQGSVINTMEEDADTWSYTVRMMWQSMFV